MREHVTLTVCTVTVSSLSPTFTPTNHQGLLHLIIPGTPYSGHAG